MFKRSIYLIALLLVVAGCSPSAKVSSSTGQTGIKTPTKAVSNKASGNTALPTGTTASQSAAHQTFTVLVGASKPEEGADLEAYFPSAIHVHAGDTVTWKANSTEIHTVTFLGGTAKTPDTLVPVPNAKAGEMMFNPKMAYPVAPKDGQYDGSSYANSGIMGEAEGQAKEFSLTFTKPGKYEYVCILHNEEKMTGTVIVEEANAKIAAPDEVQAQAQKELNALMAQIPEVVKAAEAATRPDENNADGTVTHFVLVGFSQGQIDLEYFFPRTLDVTPGDTISWIVAKEDVAPHTITFLNGAKEPEIVLPQPQPNGPPLLEINPEVAVPMNVEKPLTNQGIYNSGLIDPHMPGDHTFSLKVGDYTGDLPYMCTLHDANGMKGDIVIASKEGHTVFSSMIN